MSKIAPFLYRSSLRRPFDYRQEEHERWMFESGWAQALDYFTNTPFIMDSDINNDDSDYEDETDRQIEYGRLHTRLVEIKSDVIACSRLAEIEQMILNDLINDPRPMRCSGCLRWAKALIEKAGYST